MNRKPYDNEKCLACNKELVFLKWSGKDKKYCDNVCQNTYQNKYNLRAKPIPYPKEMLESLYLENKLSVSQIAKQLNTHTTGVHRWLKRYGIPTRPFGTKGLLAWNNGKPMREESKDKIRKARLGTKMPREYVERLRKRMLENNPFKGKKHTNEYKKWMSESRQGANGPNWRGGIWAMHKKERATYEIRLARTSALIRDDYTCQICGLKKGKRQGMEVDHIKPFALYPELRAAIDNLRTLCHDCHVKTETYGGATKKINN